MKKQKKHETIEMTPEEFRKMQLLQLDMLVELDRICRLHNISYCITAGTLLGAVRHKGYIPWDDDADIAMLREDYERLKKVVNELNPEICWFQDHSTDPDYLWGYGKLRRTGTTFVRTGQEHLKAKTGVFIDIFPFDDIPMQTTGMVLQDIYCFFLRKSLWARVGSVSGKGVERFLYRLLSFIPVEWSHKMVNKMAKKSRNDLPNKVRPLLFPSFGKMYMKCQHPAPIRYGIPKKWIVNRSEYLFEGHQLYGTKDYDAFLKYMYGDYMKLPPLEKRGLHAPVSSFSFENAKVNYSESQNTVRAGER